MINLKTLYSRNKKHFTKSHSYLVWCIIALFIALSCTFKGICDVGSTKSTITLPLPQDGIEKIEYTIDGVAKGSTAGVGKIQVENGSVLSFAVKFEDEGYSQLRVRDVKIESEKGSILRLNTYSKVSSTDIALMRVSDTETIDPKQTYISSDYIVESDDKFSVTGVAEDNYSVVINDEDNDVHLSDAIELKYSESGGSYVDVPFSEEKNAFVLNNIKNSSNTKLMINVKEGHTDANLSLVYGESELAINSKSKVCSLPELSDNLNIYIRGLQRKSYSVAFNEYTNADFSYKNSDQEDFSTSPKTTKVYYGDTIEFVCSTNDQEILQNSEVTANGLVIKPENDVYKIKNVKSDYTIAVTPKSSALYPVSLQNNESRIKLCNLSENEVSSINVNQNGDATFKIKPDEAYSKNFITTQIYAVPISKTVDGTYDINANPDEAASFLVIPNSDNVYSVKNVTEPIVLIPTNLQASGYTVTMPDKIIGAKATVRTNENVQQISDTKFNVTHGSDFVVDVEAEPGYDISNMIVGDMDDSTQVLKDGNTYTYKSINSDKYLIINGAETARCNVRFDSKNLIVTDMFGSAWKDNSSTIKYQEGTLQFKIKLQEMQNVPSIELAIKSGNGTLEKTSSESNIYSLSNVTEDTVIGVGNENSQDVTINLVSADSDIQFTDINDESVILPGQITLKLGQDLDFKVVSKSGKSVDNVKINSSNSSNLITENSSISNAYTLTALGSGSLSTEEPTKNITSAQLTSNTSSATRTAMLRSGTAVLTSGDSNTRDVGNSTDGEGSSSAQTQISEDDYRDKVNCVDFTQCDRVRKIVGLTLADYYVFPQATNNSSQGTNTSGEGTGTSGEGTGTSGEGTGTSGEGTGTSGEGTGTSGEGTGTSGEGTGTSGEGTGTSNTGTNTSNQETASQDYATNEILPSITLDKEPKYVVFSSDERAEKCINKDIIEFHGDNATFQISENRNASVLTLPPLIYRYRASSIPGFAWYDDAYSPGDDYYDPSQYTSDGNNKPVPPTGNTPKYPGGTFSLGLTRSNEGNGKYKLSFDNYTISSTRDVYGHDAFWRFVSSDPRLKYDRHYSITRNANTAQANDGISPNNHIIATVPRIINNNNYNDRISRNYDDLDYLWPFIENNIYGYETPYLRHSTSKHFDIRSIQGENDEEPTDKYFGSTIEVRGEAFLPDSSATPKTVTFDPEGVTEPTLLYRLPNAYCHVFDELYNTVKIDKSQLGTDILPVSNITLSGASLGQTTGLTESIIIRNNDSQDFDPLKRVERTFTVTLPTHTTIRYGYGDYEAPLELDNRYNEIVSQTVNYDEMNQCSSITVKANMSQFEESLVLKWKPGIMIRKPGDKFILNDEDIPRTIISGDYGTRITLSFTGSPKPTANENENHEIIKNEYVIDTTPFNYYTDPDHVIKFTVQLPDNYIINEDQEEPLYICFADGTEVNSELIQDVSYDRDKILCTLKGSAYDSSSGKKMLLKWKDFENDIVNIARKIKLTSDNTVFRDSRETPINSDYVKVGDGFVFYTEPREGCKPSEKLIIDTHTFGRYYLEDITNSQYREENDTKAKKYAGQWIQLSEDEHADETLFIRANRQSDMIKYEIASSREMNTEYLKAIKSNEHQDVQYILHAPETVTTAGITSDVDISSIRAMRELQVTFADTPGIEYLENDGSPMLTSQDKFYGDTIAFKVKAEEGYDISNLEIVSSTPTKTNTIALTNGVYVVANITENTTISANNVQKSKINLSFNQYDGVSYTDTSGNPYSIRQYLPYNEEIVFQINVEPGYSTENMTVSAEIEGAQNSPYTFASGNDHNKPYINNNLYIIPAECVTGDIKIKIKTGDDEGLKKITHKVTLTPPKETDLKNAISFRNQYGTADLSNLEQSVNYGESFKFQILTHDGFDTSEIEVVAKSDSGSAVTIIPANGVYTIENVTDDYTVTVSGIKHENHNVEFRTSTGVAFLDGFGNTLPSSVTVADGDKLSFYLSFDDAYSKSKETAKVLIKGSNNTVPHDSSGKYTLGGTTGITKDQIIEVTNVTKNSYTVTFVPAEGVIYKTAKGKEFEGTLQLEYGEDLYFKISLMDAYDQSVPAVKLNGNKNLVENSGSYVIENINEDVVVTVENIDKNPEEVAIESINHIPNPVANEDDVDAVIRATKAYDSLSDDEKKLVTNKQDLERAQNEAGDINHQSGDVNISGLDWYVKLIATPLNDDQEQMNAFAEKIEKRDLLSLYKVELVNMLTGENYEIPYGTEVQIVLPSPDLTGYKNTTVAHENTVGNMEYIDPNIVDGSAKFKATSAGLFGIAAKAIPNYSEDVSDMTISMGSLAKNDDELKTLLGDDLSSQLGHLIDLEDETGNNSDGNGDSSGNSSTDVGQNDDGSDSILGNMAKKTTELSNKIYNWALENEFAAVLAILLLGFGLIALILASSRKKSKDKK